MALKSYENGWPANRKVSSLVEAKRALERAQRTILATESTGRGVKSETKRLAEALEWALAEVNRLAVEINRLIAEG